MVASNQFGVRFRKRNAPLTTLRVCAKKTAVSRTAVMCFTILPTEPGLSEQVNTFMNVNKGLHLFTNYAIGVDSRVLNHQAFWSLLGAHW